ncbi:MAG: acyl-CoA thioesterase [Solirubrobacteraceae bacterium]
MSTPFVHAERIRFGHLDAMRHLNNVEFLRFFETARIEFLRTVIPEHDPADPDDFGLIFAECHINYRSPGQYDDLVETTVRPIDIKRSSFRVSFEMRVGERLLAEGWGALVGYDYGSAKSTPLPSRVADALHAASAA